jgi:hypothetical protein
LILLAAAFVGFSIFGVPLVARQSGVPARAVQPPPSTPPPAAAEPELKQVEYKADEIYNYPNTDTIILVKNVVMHHNGSVLVCDSAVRYSASRFDCFGHVIINQDSMYVYGRRAEYDRDHNTARVYDRLIKVVNGNSTLYTYNFSFNTLDNIGRYWGGGTLVQDSNRMESDRGWYHSTTRDVYGAGAVEMTDPEYKLRGDSVRYNMNDEVAEFYTLTHIWNSKGEVLSATKGKYYHLTETYDLAADSYVLTAEQEAWADSMLYHSQTEDVVMRRNIQLRDEEQQSMAFGDYGEYWGGREEGFLTRDPALVSFDREVPEDSVFMRADSIFIFSLPWEADYETYADSVRQARQRAAMTAEDSLALAADSVVIPPAEEILPPPEVESGLDENAEAERQAREMMKSMDQWPAQTDPAMRASLHRMLIDQKRAEYERGDTLTVGMLSAEVRERLLVERVAVEDLEGQLKYNELKRASADPTQPLNDSTMLALLQGIGMLEREPERPQVADSMHGTDSMRVTDSMQVKDSADVAPPVAKEETKRERRRRERAEQNAARRRQMVFTPPAAPRPVLPDSLATDSLKTDSLLVDSVVVDSLPVEHDSLQRVVKAYRDVRIWRSDFQAVCDSLTGFSKDSTAHMYIDPIVWNGANQITSTVIDIYTRNQQIDRVFFEGNPLMISEVDTARYNQIKGLEMETFFIDGEVARHRVEGNAQTLYYMAEEQDPPHTFMSVTSSNAIFTLENREVIHINWGVKPHIDAYPILGIPPEVEQRLEGFRWEPERKPTRTGVLSRTIRPSRREEYEAMPQPQFPLTERIEQHKRQMIDRREWEDRYELLPQHATEFLRTIQIDK